MSLQIQRENIVPLSSENFCSRKLNWILNLESYSTSFIKYKCDLHLNDDADVPCKKLTYYFDSFEHGFGSFRQVICNQPWFKSSFQFV